MRKEAGSVGDLISAALCMLAMTILLNHYLECVRLIQQKMEISQVARKYILQMETVGSLPEEARQRLCDELEEIGVEHLQLVGTTTGQVSYGEEIVLQIQGELADGYVFTERKVSTAKY